MKDTPIEKTTKQSLSFIEQLQNQIELCREAISDLRIPLTPRVQALELLLWAKLKDDIEYSQRIKELNIWTKNKRKELKEKNNDLPEWRFEELISPYHRTKSKEKFKAIMIFIDKKGYMPIGDY